MTDTYQLWAAIGASMNISKHKMIADQQSFGDALAQRNKMKREFEIHYITETLAGREPANMLFYIRDAFEPMYTVNVCILSQPGARTFYSKYDAELWQEKLADVKKRHNISEISISTIDTSEERGENMPTLLDSDNEDSNNDLPALLDSDDDSSDNIIMPALLNNDDEDLSAILDNALEEIAEQDGRPHNLMTGIPIVREDLIERIEQIRRLINTYNRNNMQNSPGEFRAIVACNNCAPRAQRMSRQEMTRIAVELPTDFGINRCAFCRGDLH